MSFSGSWRGNEDTELQEDVTDGGQRLGSFAVAATGPSESHILQTTTLTVDEDGRGDLVDSGANA